MRPFPILLALFIVLPLIEIYLFIQIGGFIGALATVACVVITALLGVLMLRAQGFQTMAKFQQQIAMGELPAETMLEGVALLIGGALLLTPGFLTDALGFLCLVPLTRRAIIRGLLSKLSVRSFAGSVRGSSSHTRDDRIIEGEAKRKDHDLWH